MLSYSTQARSFEGPAVAEMGNLPFCGLRHVLLYTRIIMLTKAGIVFRGVCVFVCVCVSIRSKKLEKALT